MNVTGVIRTTIQLWKKIKIVELDYVPIVIIMSHFYFFVNYDILTILANYRQIV